MTTFDDDPVRRRPDGSIDIQHYVAEARRARSDEAKVLWDASGAMLQRLTRGGDGLSRGPEPTLARGHRV